MNNPNIKFKILSTGNRIYGFSLCGSGDTEADEFCLNFGEAYEIGAARIEVRTHELIFKNDGQEHRAAITQEEAQKLFDILNQRGEYAHDEPTIELIDDFQKGFSLSVEEFA